MVTVGIVGILAAIAIPIYNNYITKTRIADALTHGRVYAGKVTIDREDPVEPPAHLEYSKIELWGSQENPRVRIKLKKTIDSTVLMDPDERAGGKVIVLSEESSDASARWACTTNLPQALIPEGCTYEKGVKDRKLPEAWAKGKDACWSNARFNETGNGWAAGSCTSCTRGMQKKMNRKAKKEMRPGAAKKWGAACSGLYGSDEVLVEDEVVLSTDIGTPWENVPVDQRGTVTACWDRSHANDKRDGLWVVGPNNVPAGRAKHLRASADRGGISGAVWDYSLTRDCVYCSAEEAYCVDETLTEEEAATVAEAARVAGLPPGEAEREEAWDRKVESGESTDGIPWAEVPARSADTVSPCWDWTVSQDSVAADGDGNGWVAGERRFTGEVLQSSTQIEVRQMARNFAQIARCKGAGSRRLWPCSDNGRGWTLLGLRCVPKIEPH